MTKSIKYKKKEFRKTSRKSTSRKGKTRKKYKKYVKKITRKHKHTRNHKHKSNKRTRKGGIKCCTGDTIYLGRAWKKGWWTLPDSIHPQGYDDLKLRHFFMDKVNIYYEACDNNGNWQIMLAREI